MFVERIRKSCIGKSGFWKSLLKQSTSMEALKIPVLFSVISVVPRGFFRAPRSVKLKDSVMDFFKIHRKASFTIKHIYALVAVHTFIEKKFNKI